VTRQREEPIVDGRPALALRDEDVEAIADVLAEALVEELEREGVKPA
jgi:hypothetical protein